MAEIRPFRAWRYNFNKIHDPSAVVAPPYDVISKEEQERLYQASPYNVIRLELGKPTSCDTDTDNVYTRAQAFMREWKESEVLAREDAPALYIYVQDYPEEGKNKTRIGFYAAMKLDEKAVLKHENTLTGPKEDRLKLLKEVRANLSPIFGLFEDKKGIVQSQLKKIIRQDPLMDISAQGVRHRLYKEERPAVVQAVVRAMGPKPMFIADGHHRFEVACQYKKWRRSQAGASSNGRAENWEYVMAYFSDCRHNPFKIFPTHRLIRLAKGKELLKELQKIGTLKKLPDLKAVLAPLDQCREDAKDKGYRFGLYSAKEGFWLLTLNAKTASSIKKDPVQKLDVAVLHKKILEPCFDIRAVERCPDIDFTRDAKEAVEKVKSGLFDAAVFLRPTSLNEMLYVSKKGLKMPQKSTYFYPKLLTGLVFHDVA